MSIDDYGSTLQNAPDYKALYLELLNAVVMKYRGETRHGTALRYIQQAEEGHTLVTSVGGASRTPPQEPTVE